MSTRRSIVLDGRDHYIPDNLFVAISHLRNMRGSDKNIHFWIDALSINQSDLHERDQQIRLMKDIYEQAYKVLVWLGPPTSDSELALAKMRALEAYLYISDKCGEDPVTAIVKDQCRQSQASAENAKVASRLYYNLLPGSRDQADPTDESWAAICRVFEHPWWKRAWIAQEVSGMAFEANRRGNVEIILGRQLQTIPFRSTIQLVPTLISRLWKSELPENLEDISSQLEQLGKTASVVTELLDIARLRKKQTFAHYFASFSFWWSEIERERYRWATRVSPMLQNFRVRDTSDTRDKVYAALPLVLPNDRPAFQPNYGSTVEDVYAQLVENCVRYERNLNILTAGSLVTLVTSEIPSFIPDWRRVAFTTIEFCRFVDSSRKPIYKACSSTLPEMTIATERPPDILPRSYRSLLSLKQRPKERLPKQTSDHVLYARGLEVDTIVDTAPDCEQSRLFRRPQWEALLADLPRWYSPSRESLVCAYQRLLRADISSTNRIRFEDTLRSRRERIAFEIGEMAEFLHEIWMEEAYAYEPSHASMSYFTPSVDLHWIAHNRGARTDASLIFGQPEPINNRNLALNDDRSFQRERSGSDSTEKMEEGHDSVEPNGRGRSKLRPSSALLDDRLGRDGASDAEAGTTEHGRVHEQNPASTSDDSIPESLIEYSTAEDKVAAEKRLRDLIAEVTTDRVLCVTRKGYIGLVPQFTMAGDKIVVLFGGLTLFVLHEASLFPNRFEFKDGSKAEISNKDKQNRPVRNESSNKIEDKNENSEDENCDKDENDDEKEGMYTRQEYTSDFGKDPKKPIYQLVGEAYVHGIMDGQLFEGLSDKQIRELSDSFVIV
ncbi:MAG: hypothetical protein M1820_003248 [Bogoriella megaspora]|nr:MAG: hypothetical protein M1820_003248 [Bogoriella megaspora]